MRLSIKISMQPVPSEVARDTVMLRLVVAVAGVMASVAHTVAVPVSSATLNMAGMDTVAGQREYNTTDNITAISLGCNLTPHVFTVGYYDKPHPVLLTKY